VEVDQDLVVARGPGTQAGEDTPGHGWSGGPWFEAGTSNIAGMHTGTTRADPNYLYFGCSMGGAWIATVAELLTAANVNNPPPPVVNFPREWGTRWESLVRVPGLCHLLP
jgi:hypothetical protein